MADVRESRGAITHIQSTTSEDRRAPLLALGIGSALLVVTAPWEVSTVTSALECGLAAAILTGLISWMVLRRRSVAAALSLAFALAYVMRLGPALSEGVYLAREPIASEDLRIALYHFLAFAAIWGVVAMFPHKEQVPTPTSSDTANLVPLAAFLLLSAGQAFSKGTWTYYGDSSLDVEATTGGFRLDLQYPSALLAMASFFLTRWTPLRSRFGRWVVVAAVATILLLFLLQMRRLMIAAALLGLATALSAARWRASRMAAVAGGGVIAGMLLVLSADWRAGDNSASPLERLGQAFERGTSNTAFEQETVLERFTYLSLDSVAIRHGADSSFTLGDLWISSLYTALPGVIAPNKYEIGNLTCEVPLSLVGYEEDLPCTPVAEGVLSWGFPGVVLVALVFGLQVWGGERLWRRDSVAAVMFVFPCFTVECSAFPIFQGLRAVAFWWVFRWVVVRTYRFLSA